MRSVVLALVLLLGGVIAAEARCADEMKEFSARVETQQKRNPTAQSAAAAKELRKASLQSRDMGETECYNALARARRALTAPPPEAAAEVER